MKTINIITTTQTNENAKKVLNDDDNIKSGAACSANTIFLEFSLLVVISLLQRRWRNIKEQDKHTGIFFVLCSFC